MESTLAFDSYPKSLLFNLFGDRYINNAAVGDLEKLRQMHFTHGKSTRALQEYAQKFYSSEHYDYFEVGMYEFPTLCGPSLSNLLILVC